MIKNTREKSWAGLSFLILLISFACALTVAKAYITGVWNMDMGTNFVGFALILFGVLGIINYRSTAQMFPLYNQLEKKGTFYAKIFSFFQIALGFAYITRWNVESLSIVGIFILLAILLVLNFSAEKDE